MATHYHIDNENNVVLYELDTDFSAETAKEMFSLIGPSLEKDRVYNELITVSREADLSGVSQEDFIRIIRSMKWAYEYSGVRRQRSAIVAAEDHKLRPMAIMWVAYCELDEEISSTYRAFSQLEDACQWVKISSNSVEKFMNKKGDH